MSDHQEMHGLVPDSDIGTFTPMVASGPTPTLLMTVCATCGKTISMDGSYSFAITFLRRGHPDLAPFQHPPQEDMDNGNYKAQLFSCSLECATAAAHKCIDTYFRDQHAQTSIVESGNAPAQRDKSCALAACAGTMAQGYEYAFAITFATRGPEPRAGSFQCHNLFGDGLTPAFHECCSLDCAIKAAHACIDEHLVVGHHLHVKRLKDQDDVDKKQYDEMMAYMASQRALAHPVNKRKRK